MFALKILQQIPKILLAIRSEHEWLKKAVADNNIQAVISDNRYGLYHEHIPSIFITHQLLIVSPFNWLTALMQRVNYSFIRKFTACWVPDFGGRLNIAGRLSHPEILPSIPIKYLGPLSRLSPRFANKPFTYKWLFLLSGPEPQRSILEKLFIELICKIGEPVWLVRGLPGKAGTLSMPDHCKVANHLSTADLQTAFEQSEYVISRSGYTSVMEILSQQKKSILIPTPGQTEQEYLAQRLMKQHWCYSIRQTADIATHLKLAQQFSYSLPAFPDVMMPDVVHNFLSEYRVQN